jgi:hypothetical protein
LYLGTTFVVPKLPQMFPGFRACVRTRSWKGTGSAVPQIR